jgi:hypothetical protein
MLRPMLIEQPNLLNESITSNNKFMIFCREPMPSTSSTIVNIGYHTSFRWEIRHDYICRKSTSQDPIIISTHCDMGLTPSPRLWVRMILNQVSPLSLACTQYLMWNCFDHIFHLSLTLWMWPSIWPLKNSILTPLNMI